MVNRNGSMTGIIQIVVTIAMMFFLALSAGSNYCSMFPAGDRSEPASEEHRTCSLDENTGRISSSSQPGVINQLRNKIRYSVVSFQKPHYVFASSLQKPAVTKDCPDISRVFLSTTVLRI